MFHISNCYKQEDFFLQYQLFCMLEQKAKLLEHDIFNS